MASWLHISLTKGQNGYLVLQEPRTVPI